MPKGNLLIEEVYYSGAVPTAGIDRYYSDQFIEIENIADAPVMVGGLIIGTISSPASIGRHIERFVPTGTICGRPALRCLLDREGPGSLGRRVYYQQWPILREFLLEAQGI